MHQATIGTLNVIAVYHFKIYKNIYRSFNKFYSEKFHGHSVLIVNRTCRYDWNVSFLISDWLVSPIERSDWLKRMKHSRYSLPYCHQLQPFVSSKVQNKSLQFSEFCISQNCKTQPDQETLCKIWSFSGWNYQQY